MKIMFKLISLLLISLVHKSSSSSMMDFKVVYSDDIFSFDFNNITLNTEEEKQKQVINIYISEKQIKDSLICYILVRNNATIHQLTNYTHLFQLDYIGLITNYDSIHLYSIKLIHQIDYEQQFMYELQIIANNSIIIHVNDTNDNSPIFEQTHYTFNITENNQVPACFGFIKATDADSTELNGPISYKLVDSTLIGFNSTSNETMLGNNLFYLNNQSQLCTQLELDREKYSKYTIEAIAYDSTSSNQTSCLIQINVVDLNDNPPRFYTHETNLFYLKENSAENTFIAWLNAYDLDETNEIEYRIEANSSLLLFNIDSKGVLRTSKNLTNETTESYSLDIIAHDKSLETKLHIHIKLISQEQYEKQLKLECYPNRSLFLIRTDLIHNYYNRSIVKLNTNSSNELKFQLVPIISNNCTHNDVLKWFNLSQNGELFIKKQVEKAVKNQMCLLKIKATDLSHPIQLSNQIEFTFIFTDHPLMLNANKSKLEQNHYNHDLYLVVVYFVILIILFFVLISLICFNYYNNKSKNKPETSSNNRLVKLNMKKLFKWFDTSTNCNESSISNEVSNNECQVNVKANDDGADDLPKIYKITNKVIIKYENNNEQKLNNISSFSSFSSTTTMNSSRSKKSIVEEQLEKFEKIYYDNKKYLDSNLSILLFDNYKNNNNNNKQELII